jgi:hypothetical protein
VISRRALSYSSSSSSFSSSIMNGGVAPVFWTGTRVGQTLCPDLSAVVQDDDENEYDSYAGLRAGFRLDQTEKPQIGDVFVD